MKKVYLLLLIFFTFSLNISSQTITTPGMYFSPDTLVVNVGDTITLIMDTSHNAVEVSQSTWLTNGTLSNGGFNISFGTTGTFIPSLDQTYYYVCQPHVTMGMKGIIIANSLPIYGCTDTTAYNYDSLATIDDSSCIYAGCLDTNALNYNPIASIDDSSCTYVPTCTQLTLNMYDSYGDGWNGNDFTLVNSSGTTVFSTTLSSGYSGVDSVCLPDDCYTVSCGGGSWQGEVSWTLYGANFILSGGAPYSNFICFPTILGCINPLANNYDSLANIDDGSCLYDCIDVDTTESFESGQGITWMLDPNNDIDWTNNTGGTSSFNTGPSSAFDGSYYMYTESSVSGTGYPNMESIMYVPCIDPNQWSQLSLVFAFHMYGATMGTLSIDVSSDSGATWIEEWTLTGDQGDQWTETFIDLSAYTSNISVRVQAETGSSYTSDIAVDLLRFLELPIVGCMNPLADNYDSTAVIDDGSCFFSNCTQLTLNMYDSYGDGWNGNDFTLVSSSGMTFFTSTLSSGSSGSASVCVPDDCYSVNCGGGSWQYEVSWTLTDSSGIVLLSGGAPYSGNICFPVIVGCMNPLANNYDSTANIDNGLCFFDCIDIDTTESFESGQGITWMLDQNNTVDWTNRSGGTPSNNTGPSSAYDGSYYMYTEASGSGSNSDAIMYVPCVDPTQWSQLSLAFAYHMYGTAMGTLSIDISPDSGSTWIQEWTLSGNQGDQWTEVFIDLSAYTSEVSVRVNAETGSSYTSDISIDLLRFMELPNFGCTDPFADNYDSTATYDDGSCLFIGCTDIYASNYCQSCNFSDSLSCIYYSCNILGYNEDFESNSLSLIGWTNLSGSEASVTLTNSNAISDTVSLQFEGGTNNNWSSYLTENQAFANTEHLSSASFCIDLSSAGSNDTITLTFETSMFSSLFLPYSWIRLKVDGTIVSDSYGNTSYNNQTLPYSFGANTVLTYDLSVYAGSSHYITFESVNKYGSSANNPTTVNYVWIDNINLSLPLIGGCMDTTALNYNSLAQIDNGSCLYDVYGCTDSTALNYNPLATIDDGSCIAIIYGCTDSLANNYSSLANSDDGSCLYDVYGCTDSTALNYNPLATIDDGSCIAIIYGCTDSTALNYDSLANVDDGSCIAPLYGCTDSTALNYNPLANVDDGSCIPIIYGCTDSTSLNYDSLANVDDGSCIAPIYGCTDSSAINFYAGATYDDGSCLYIGCTDSTALNYDSLASIDDGSCVYCINGCMDSTALNYDPLATCDDGSCQYTSNCPSPQPDGLYSFDVIDTRAKIGWNNMNDSSCMVWKYFVRFREVGTNTWFTKSAGVGNGLCNFGLNTVTKQLLNLNPSTTYEFKMKAFYCNRTSSNYSPPLQFTTADECPEMTNLSVQTFSNNQSKAKFTWDTTGNYVFARILLRVDSSGSSWQTAGGFGVYYPTLFVNKFGLQAGESYRAQGRTFCDSNITAYRSPSWTPPIFWTQPGSIRLSGGVSINNLDVYPNPSNNIFNITFNVDKLLHLNIKIINVLGKIVYTEEKQQFIGEYTNQISLDDYVNGIYFLEIETDNGIINKKLILH
jgi:plastocyanin